MSDSSHLLVFPMVAHVALAACLYVLLTLVRAPTVWGIGRRPDGGNPWAHLEPRISRNLSNQFEWPVVFYAGCIVLLIQHETGWLAVTLAWVFVGGRLLHSYVQIATANIRLRGLVFTVNFVAVLGLWAVALLNACHCCWRSC
ncbi:MAG TPA: MAPEG family protein [Steroidobacteraceae bacterium]|nr:MAPEG family protein [Steroidobacteraceae bacterium]